MNYSLTKACMSDVENFKKSKTLSNYKNYTFHINKTGDSNNSSIKVEYISPIEELILLNDYEISLETSYNCEGNELVVEKGYTCISAELNSCFIGVRSCLAVDYYFRKNIPNKNLPNNRCSTICVHIVGDYLHPVDDNIHPKFVAGKQYTLVIK